MEEMKQKDPSVNVREMIEESSGRLDDLRGAESKRVDEITLNNKEHFKEISDLRADYDKRLDVAEAKRIDAIRVVDVQAVSVASDKAAQQATVLATQVSTSAETLRALVASSATATAAQLTQIITPITDRISLLEKNQYQGVGATGLYVTQTDLSTVVDKIQTSFETALKPVIAFMNSSQGKEGVTDPAMAKLAKSVEDLVGTKSQGISASWGFTLGIIGLIGTILGIFAIVSRFLP